MRALLALVLVACGRHGYDARGDAGVGLDAPPTPSPCVASAAAGAQHACAVRDDGRVFCWGFDLAGQLGAGGTWASGLPVEVVGLSGVRQVVAGSLFTCASTADDRVSCWGDGTVGQLGQAAFAGSATPVEVAIAGVEELAAAAESACARKRDGTVWCWGSDIFGQLGDGAPLANAATPVQVAAIADARELSGGAYHFCARLGDGTVACWGDGTSGQLGQGSYRSSEVPVPVSELSGAIAIGAGGTHSCAVVGQGAVACWGSDHYLQLGRGDGLDALTPASAAGLADARALALGGQHSCALRAGGEVACFGSNLSGQLGDGTIRPRDLGDAIAVSDAVQVVAGDQFTCAVTGAGGLSCWGADAHYPLARGLPITRAAPTPVRRPTAVGAWEDLAVGWEAACGVLGGALYCWGSNASRVFGEEVADSGAPVLVIDTGVTRIDLGQRHRCVLAQGRVSCWGANDLGQTGVPTSTYFEPVTEVASLGPSVAVDTGYDHTCAVLEADASVWCWGDNRDGELGVATPESSVTPLEVAGLPPAAAVAGGHDASCAVSAVDGSVWCWGANGSGQLGDGTTDPSSVPVQARGIAGAVAVSLGEGLSCALLDTGRVRCWGVGSNGELGTGIVGGSLTPVDTLVDDASAIAVGYGHACALRAGGTVWCWGRFAQGARGDVTAGGSAVPRQVGTLTGMTRLAAGLVNTCASDGTDAWCWGDATHFALGDGTPAYVPTPGVVAIPCPP